MYSIIYKGDMISKDGEMNMQTTRNKEIISISTNPKKLQI